MRHKTIGNYIKGPTGLEQICYAANRRAAERFVQSENCELAEGPTQYVGNNSYGPVELWPVFDGWGWLLYSTKVNSFSRMLLVTKFTGVAVMLRILVQ